MSHNDPTTPTITLHIGYGDPNPETFANLHRTVRNLVDMLCKHYGAEPLASLVGKGYWEGDTERAGGQTFIISADQFDRVVGLMKHTARRFNQDCIAVSKLDTVFAS